MKTNRRCLATTAGTQQTDQLAFLNGEIERRQVLSGSPTAGLGSSVRDVAWSVSRARWLTPLQMFESRLVHSLLGLRGSEYSIGRNRRWESHATRLPDPSAARLAWLFGRWGVDLTQDFLQAARQGKSDVLRALLVKGANVDASNLVGETALMQAAEKGHTEVVEMLVRWVRSGCARQVGMDGFDARGR